MKHLKTYEAIQLDPQIGDYVICKDNSNSNINNFLNSNIGRFVKYTTGRDNCMIQYNFLIQYENIPEEINPSTSNNFDHAWNIKNCRGMSSSEIIHFSPNKEDLKTFIIANKYNI